MSVSAQDDLTEAMVLNAVYDAGGEVHYGDLVGMVPASRRAIWRAIYLQHNLGNIKRHREGEPIVLTSSARAAIAAGRMARA